MAQWDHGYVTDVAYTTGAYPEAAPSWLVACSAVLGYRSSDLSGPFRYADLGCGNGMSVLVTAATYPRAEVWGFDFNPTHIENARVMAAQAGLSNAHFVEISFEALAGRDPRTDATFDFVVSHGVLSWISLENRRHLAAIIGRLLRPGGLSYISYNTSTGWSGVEPVRLLMRQLAEASQRRSDQTIPEIFQLIDQLKNGGAVYFRGHPGLETRLEKMRAQDARYLAHEFLNRDWHPVMFADVADAMAETKASYIGSATLMENIDAIAVPEGVLPTLSNVLDAGLRETLRDLASAKGFRRDLWRKGGETMPALEHIGVLDAITLVWTGKAVEAEITFPGPVGTVTAQAAFYRPLLDAILEGPTTIGQLRALPALQGRQAGEFVQAAVLLMGGGFAHPALPNGGQPESRAAAARLNAALISRIRLGVDLQRLAAPVIGSTIAVDVMDALVVGQLLGGGIPAPDGPREGLPEELIDGVLRDLAGSGRSLMRDGHAVTDPSDARLLIGESVRGVLARRLSLLRLMGIVD